MVNGGHRIEHKTLNTLALIGSSKGSLLNQKNSNLYASFNRTYLCNELPEFCEKPEDSDLKDYCQENPAICMGDTSDLLFPKRNMSNSTRQEFHKAMLHIQLTHNISQNESNTWCWSVFTKRLGHNATETFAKLHPAYGDRVFCQGPRFFGGLRHFKKEESQLKMNLAAEGP
ncbi:hypothetical protein TNCV_4365631 [Trichonephila clavipes]|nr:hypothetical protein TNCV_4365631 [Trichonephila clavipes]